MNIRRVLLFWWLVFLSDSTVPVILAQTADKHLDTKSFQNEDYFASIVFPLDPTTQGVEGSLVLLQDKRMKGRKYLHTRGEDDNDVSEKPQLDYKKPLLAIISSDGKLLTSKEISNDPFVGLKIVDLTGTGRKTYAVISDHNIGWTISQGTYEWFYEIIKGRIQPLQALDERSGLPVDIDLGDSLQSYYAIVPDPKGKGKIIYELNEYLDPDNDMAVQKRYYYNGKDWVLHIHTTPGSNDVEEMDPYFYKAPEYNGNGPEIADSPAGKRWVYRNQGFSLLVPPFPTLYGSSGPYSLNGLKVAKQRYSDVFVVGMKSTGNLEDDQDRLMKMLEDNANRDRDNRILTEKKFRFRGYPAAEIKVWHVWLYERDNPVEKPDDELEVIRSVLVNDRVYEMFYIADRSAFDEKKRKLVFDSLEFLHAKPYINNPKPTPQPVPIPTPTPTRASFFGFHF